MQEEMIHDIETTPAGIHYFCGCPHVVVSTARFGPENFKLVEFLPDQLHLVAISDVISQTETINVWGGGCGETLWRSSGQCAGSLSAHNQCTHSPTNPGATE